MMIAVGFLIALIISFICWYGNRIRPQLSLDAELIPNQLLTTHTVVFLTGKKSLFYFMNYWNKLPQRLRDHGHDVEEWALPCRSHLKAQDFLIKSLKTAENENRSFHIIADNTMSELIYFLAEHSLESIQSLNLMSSSSQDYYSSNSLKPFMLPVRSHQLTESLESHRHWSQFLIGFHKALSRSKKFEPKILGVTSDQHKLEFFYLNLLSDLAVMDLRS